MYRPIRGRLLGYKYDVEEFVGRIAEYRRMSRNRTRFDRTAIEDLVGRIREESELLLNAGEACLLFSCVKNTAKVPGDLAEVGVYKGGSAKIICEAKGDRSLDLFDTFEGIPSIDRGLDGNVFKEGQYAASLEEVKRYLDRYPMMHYYKGRFPLTAGPVKEKVFSFVNLDVDTHDSTWSCLEFFYPRMHSGGLILCHDYCDGVPGVKSAVDRFFEDKAEPIIEISGFHGIVGKI
ncbi:MAG: macrocin-O-methyltransferase [Methanobacteriota archaeon]|nr:MAG: macrocin-O-methyltransferase [Euryarchaeota archaeon]